MPKRKKKKLEVRFQYPPGVFPTPGEDIAFGLSLLHEGYLLAHETGDLAGLCWCEPELTNYNEDDDTGVYVHRKRQ